MNRRRSSLRALGLLAAICVMGQIVAAQGGAPAPKPPATPKTGALIDLTGYWVSLVDDEWRWRMMTPAKGDYSFVPLNAEGRRVAGLWDPAKDEAEGNQCRVFGAAGIMRLPERLHVTWADDNTLEMNIDAGTQRRLFHFDGSKWSGGEAQWQGESVAAWEKQRQSRGFGRPVANGPSEEGGSLKVVTTHMRPGYLRKNGVPYSGNAVLIEYFDRFDLDGESYLVVTGVVDDPQYLTGKFVTTEQFKLERDGAKWNPTPCKVALPTRAPARAGGF